MITKFYNKLIDTIKHLEKKTVKIMKIGLKFSFITAIIAAGILITYLFFVHNYIIYEIGLLVFQLSLYFVADFIVSGITVDSIHKQLF